MYCFHLGVFLISVKPLSTEITENKTTLKVCKFTVVDSLDGMKAVHGHGGPGTHTHTHTTTTTTTTT